MRLIHPFIIAGSLFFASAAIAQGNAAAPGNSVVANSADQNAATASPTIVGGPIDQNAAAPAAATPDQVTVPPPEHRGFPFGVIGLIGLLGLFGVRKVKS